jgi:NitT/TauT family transport system substrate-binding protein
MTILSRRAAVGAAIAAPFLSLKGAHGQDKRKVSFTLSWIPDGTNAYAYVARAKGYWDELGLDVSISRGFGSLAGAQAVSSGQFQFGTAAATAGIQQFAKGAPVVSIASLGYDALMGICTLRSRGIKTARDLVGKKLGCTTASGEYPFLPLFAEKSGFDLSRVNINTVDVNVRQRLMMSGQVDAISCFTASSIPVIVTANEEPQVFLYSKAGINLYNLCLLTKPSLLKDEPKLCADVTTGLLKAMKYTMLDLDDAVKLIIKEVPEIALAAQAAEQIKIGLGLTSITMLEDVVLKEGMGYSGDKDYSSMTDLVMKYIANPSDARPKLDELYSNKFVGGVRMTAAEWAVAQKQVEPYRKYFM